MSTSSSRNATEVLAGGIDVSRLEQLDRLLHRGPEVRIVRVEPQGGIETDEESTEEKYAVGVIAAPVLAN